jgi:hypothetical protein
VKWFEMAPSCGVCRLRFERAQGWFFRYSRSLWLALELLVNPEP